MRPQVPGGTSPGTVEQSSTADTTLPEVHRAAVKTSYSPPLLAFTSQIRTSGGILFLPSGHSRERTGRLPTVCLLYTSDAADE